ncbi:MAG: DNA translocase FtsK, partial [Phycisphaerae bacterium]|nr:DNA translocase FtsK [Phycisphaerae bacterium]
KSMMSFSPTDPPSPRTWPPKYPVDNRIGIVGAHVAWFLRYWLGAGTYAVLVVLTVAAGVCLIGKRVGELPWRATGLALLTTAVSAMAFLAEPGYRGEIVEGSAGILGMASGRFLLQAFGAAGSWIVAVIALAIGAMLSADNLLKALGKRLWHRRSDMAVAFATLASKHKENRRLRRKEKQLVARAAADKAACARAQVAESSGAERLRPPVARPKTPGGAERPQAAKPQQSPVDEARATVPADNAKTGEKKPSRLAVLLGKQKKRCVETSDAAEQQVARAPTTETVPVARQAESASKQAQAAGPAAKQPAAQTSRTSTTAVAASSKSASKVSGGKAASGKRPVKVKRAYEVPSLDLLEVPTGGYRETAEIQAAQRKLVLQQTLDDFGVDATVMGYMTGPVITLFEVALEPGVKVAAISNLSTDIARSLAVPAVRIVPPRFGKDTVGVEVPNLEKEIVRIRDLMNRIQDAEKKMCLPLYLGKDAGGEAIVQDLAKAPHMLIAGTTGSGKSVCINTIIMSLLMTRTPSEVRFILVDPKMVEMAAFERLPHLLCPTINDMKKAEDILEWACTKMAERYELLREARVKSLAQYNALRKKELYELFEAETEEEKARIPHPMPSYVIIIDELADLMMTSSKEVEGFIIRIAQKARAVGIHLVLATQRPSANVVTGLIKSNMPCRVSFQVASGQESRIVLDSKGAEVLLGQGDMLVLQPGTSNLIRAQGTFVDDSEIRAVVKELEKGGEQVFDTELMKLQSKPAGDLDGEKDEYFDQAVEIILAAGRGSVSLLQRRLSIGYGRASRIIDQMTEAGLLGSHRGSQARECMMTLEEWQDMQAGIAADQSGANSLNGAPTTV